MKTAELRIAAYILQCRMVVSGQNVVMMRTGVGEEMAKKLVNIEFHTSGIVENRLSLSFLINDTESTQSGL